MSDQKPYLRSSHFFRAYIKLHENLKKQRFIVIKKEFVHLKYCFYIIIFRLLIHDKIKYKGHPQFEDEYKLILKKLQEYCKDFSLIKEYKTNIKYLFIILNKDLNISQLKNNKDVSRIFKKKEVILSTFTYETLFTLLKQKNFQHISKVISENMIEIVCADSQKKEAYVAQNVFPRDKRLVEIDHVNQANYVTGMSRDLYNFISKLEDIFQKKQNFQIEKLKKDIRIFPREELFDPKAKFPIEKSSDTFLSNCPEYKNKYLVDFGKAYLNRRIVDKDNDPSILKLDLGDLDFKVSVVELNVIQKVLILGYISGKIRVIMLYMV
jgi:hypothetical protein